MTDRRLFLLRTALVWILLELLAAAQVRAPSGELVAWTWARAAASPVVWFSEKFSTLVSDLATGVSDTGTLVVTNRELLLKLETREAFQEIMAEDLAALLELNSLAATIPNLTETAVPARSIFRDLARGRMVVRVSEHRRIPPDTPVVASGGVAGRVIHSDHQRCWIELITHPAAAIAVQTPDGLVQGLAVGSGSGELEVQFIPRQSRLLRDTRLVTSGADGIYPPDIPVGRVIAVRESASAFLEVGATPTAALATSRVVLLLEGWAVGIPPGDLER